MSVNCIRCVKNRRTGLDLLCDECRGRGVTPTCPKHPDTKMVYADGTQPHHDEKRPHWRCELWVGGGVCGATMSVAVAKAMNHFHLKDAEYGRRN